MQPNPSQSQSPQPPSSPEEIARELVKETGATLDAVEDKAKRLEQWAERELGRPAVAGAVAGTALVVAAAVAGVAEAVVGAVGAYVVFRAVKRRARARAHG